MLVLVKCCKRFNSGNFEHYFARSFRNYLDKLHNYHSRLMRKGVELPLDVLENQDTAAHQGQKFNMYNVGFARSQEFVRKRNESAVLEGLRDRAKRAIPLLNSNAVRLLKMVTDPLRTAEAEEQAYKEYLRRRHLRSLGIRCPGKDQYRLKKRHFQRALGISRSELRSAIQEIQSVDFTLQRGGNRWPRNK